MWRYHSFSQRNMTTQRAVGGVRGDREVRVDKI